MHRERLARTPEVFGSDVLTRLRRGAAVTGAAVRLRPPGQRIWRRRVLEALEGRDLLLSPACPIPGAEDR